MFCQYGLSVQCDHFWPSKPFHWVGGSLEAFHIMSINSVYKRCQKKMNLVNWSHQILHSAYCAYQEVHSINQIDQYGMKVSSINSIVFCASPIGITLNGHGVMKTKLSEREVPQTGSDGSNSEFQFSDETHYAYLESF